MAAALEDAQTEVMNAREDQFKAKRRVQELERELGSAGDVVKVNQQLWFL
eukprot:COSAG01_NODE_31077_length_604_cov_0.974257_1_plen_50_part_00